MFHTKTLQVILMSRYLLSLIFFGAGFLMASPAHALDSNRCYWGKLPNGDYHVACDTAALTGRGILQNRNASEINGPRSYDEIVSRFCSQSQSPSPGNWRTNLPRRGSCN
ncbi:hypothetical protein ECTOBSL9_2919 [Ectothiorhodospira sp. BSL-9]|nr:hypothetical protein ECTOBSL9_2919 [Ectothiorhodospira sp. BSL-9]